MKLLLAVSALSESATGVALLAAPSQVSTLLLGEPLDRPAALVVGRVCGAGLLALGVACGRARDDGSSRAARGLVMAMLLYDVAAAAVFAHARIVLGLSSALLLPVVVLHSALAIWCIACLRRRRGPPDV